MKQQLLESQIIELERKVRDLTSLCNVQKKTIGRLRQTTERKEMTNFGPFSVPLASLTPLGPINTRLSK